jgi:hypothetical protein
MRSRCSRGPWNHGKSSRNLVLADKCLPALSGSLRETPGEDALAPATGIVNGIRLSFAFWSLIGFVVILLR